MYHLYKWECLQKKILSDLAHLWLYICPQNSGHTHTHSHTQWRFYYRITSCINLNSFSLSEDYFSWHSNATVQLRLHSKVNVSIDIIFDFNCTLSHLLSYNVIFCKMTIVQWTVAIQINQMAKVLFTVQWKIQPWLYCSTRQMFLVEC